VVMRMTDIGADVDNVEDAITEYHGWMREYRQTLGGFYDDGDQSANGIFMNFMGKWTMTFGPIAGEYGDHWRDELDDWFRWMMDYYSNIDDREVQLGDIDAKLIICEVMVMFEDFVNVPRDGDVDD